VAESPLSATWRPAVREKAVLVGVGRRAEASGLDELAALDGPQDHLDRLRSIYQKRRDLVAGTLNRLGWDLEPPLGSIYVWVPTPNGETSADFAELLLDRAGVVVAPGRGYGSEGEGHVRVSLTVDDPLLEEAMDRIAGAVRA